MQKKEPVRWTGSLFPDPADRSLYFLTWRPLRGAHSAAAKTQQVSLRRMLQADLLFT